MDYSTFYDKNYDRVLQYLMSRCANKADAEDIASQAFIYCFTNWERYDPSKSTIESWLYMIVRSRWKNYCRDRMVMSDIDELSEVLTDNGDFAEEAVRLDALREDIALALEKLSRQQRAVIVLRYFENMKDAEIALKLRMTPSNVRVSAHRALKTMEAFINQREQLEEQL